MARVKKQLEQQEQDIKKILKQAKGYYGAKTL